MGDSRFYLPVVDLLKGYLQIGDRDKLPGAMREKVTGKLLALDRAPRADATQRSSRCSTSPVEDRRWEGPRPAPAAAPAR